ncbi:MAG: helix-turn-helix domain-containing protein [Oscillospiraceae bacterium]|nr:helix-turn-helix domain-containing protein [Oscillospiraceae bacterium]
MANKVGPLIKEARTGAGLTQEQLAKQVDGVTASDISKAERGEKELTQAQLRAIAKATGVTQASLLNAAKESTAKKPATTAKKPATTAKKPAASSAKKPATTAKKPATTAKKEEELKLTATEKKLLELYRAADKDTRDAAMKVLKGEKIDGGLLSSLLGGGGGGGLLDGAMDLLGLGKK